MFKHLKSGTVLVIFLLAGCNVASNEMQALNEDFEKDYQQLQVENLEALPNIEVIDGITYVDDILIVNKEISLPEDYSPGLQPEVIEAYQQMFQDGAAEGLDFVLVSDFRTYDYQAQLYQNYIARDGQEAADQYSAKPGHSEHQTGLAIDVGSSDSLTNLKWEFGDTPEFQWMKDVAHEYGFIIRYLEGKEDITGYMYEPWHLRYVGEEAPAIYESGLTLEEYLGID
ncbi:D-alanyl-D-alanine carboxypeptidase family protein [Salinicoccus sesuvii]|uniref:D-alanyl-D-alanine carboxypeptidase family protein n=1 Tax=Salinicoccus sesuvii TaxID=868281 RepID=A0ABV7N4H2_9STAP